MAKETSKDTCDPREIALKSFFLGPQAENAPWVIELLRVSLERWVKWRRGVFPSDGAAISEVDLATPEFLNRRRMIEGSLEELLARFEQEVPKFSPRYLGHMFSESSLPALIGHIVTLLHNPNNISGESSRVGVAIEDEAIGYLAKMVGYDGLLARGHFTSGGTLANFESLVRARGRCALWLSSCAANRARTGLKGGNFFEDSHGGWDRCDRSVGTDALSDWNFADQDPWSAGRKLEKLYQSEFKGPVLLVPGNKHYSWKKGAQFLGFGINSIWPIDLDEKGRLSIPSLVGLLDRAARESRPVALIVSVLGSTELGGIDPVHQVQEVVETWKKSHGVHLWHHVDAAFGGFFCTLRGSDSMELSKECRQALDGVSQVNSVTLDPHKLGYVPYSSGTIIVREPQDYYFKGGGETPYIDFNTLIDKGPFTIEGSRSAAGAVATWMTSRTLGLNEEGYGLLLNRTLRIRADLAARMETFGSPLRLAPGGDTNLLCFSCAMPGEKISVSNARTLKLSEEFSYKRNGSFIVSKTALSWKSYGCYLDAWTRSWEAKVDVDELQVIRMCIMNPFLGSVQMNVNFIDLFMDELGKNLKNE